MIDQRTSLLIPSQLPEFVRDNPDYEKFVTFLQAYYEWMEQEGGVTDGSKNLLNYSDIDRTTNEFLEYFTNDFLPYFPKDALVDKKLATKVAKELYQNKGTPASYQFLFRVLYNSDFDLFYTKDAVLKASAGLWYVAKSLRLATNDINFLNIDNYRLFGETSKSIATVENTIDAGTKIEVFISNIERLFQSGEFVRVVDSNNQDVLFDGQPLRAKIVGQISQIQINKNFRGLLYAAGDPVIAYGGLNSNTGIGAEATIGSVRTGAIERINVLTGGYGYREHPNTVISITNALGALAEVGSVNPDPTKTGNVSFIPSNTIALKRFIRVGGILPANEAANIAITGTAGQFSCDTIAIANTDFIIITGTLGGTGNITGYTSGTTYKVSTVTGTSPNVTAFTLNTAGNSPITTSIGTLTGLTYNIVTDYNFPAANLTTKLYDAFTMQSFSTYPLSSVLVRNGGGGISTNKIPVVTALASYPTDITPSIWASTVNYEIGDIVTYNGLSYICVQNNINRLPITNNGLNSTYWNVGGNSIGSLGILGPIQITDGGEGYMANDTVIFTGGSGYGAFANVTNVAANGRILNIEYVGDTGEYPTGGMGYRLTQLPTLTINSANVEASNAEIYVDGILGEGASFEPIYDNVGEIVTISISNYGEDYITAPNISLKVQDIIITNVDIGNLPTKGDIIYQGDDLVTATYIAYYDSLELLQPYANPAESIYRIRVYNYNSNPLPTSILKIDGKDMTFIMANFAYNEFYNNNGVRRYGDGTAKATATFLNGLTISQGKYLNSFGQPSSFSVLQSKIYNNYTYQITVTEAIAKYRDILLNLLHPTGMQLIGRYALKSKTKFNSTAIGIEQPRIGEDDPLNAAEPNATAWVLMDGPYGDPFYGGQSWRKMQPATVTNGKTDYIYGDERVYWDGAKWIYFNTMGIGEIAYGTGGLYPWLAHWTGHFSGAKIYSSYTKSTNYPAVP